MPELKTRWTDKINFDSPLNDYPRPQMVRENWMNLNGRYEFAVSDSFHVIPESFPDEIIVPFSPETYLSGLQIQINNNDFLWYRKKFVLPDNYFGKEIILHFGAVDYECNIYINRNKVLNHRGGYLPFELNITDYLNNDENELIVAVFDPSDSSWQDRGKQVRNSKGFWYTATSGIWQTVWLEAVNKIHFKSLKFLPDIDNKQIRIISSVNGNCKIRAIIKHDDDVVFHGIINKDETISILNPHLWSPEDPFLYDLALALYDDDDYLLDVVTSYFGMRKFSVGFDKDSIPRLFLNNNPYYFNGLLDQGYWSDGGMTPPDDEAMIFDIKSAKELGFNMLRKHIKVESLRWYYHCDKIGVVVWQDMVCGADKINMFLVGVLPNIFIRNIKDFRYSLFGVSENECRKEHEQNIYDTIDILYNVVSIGCWVLFNEGWGQFDAKRIGNEIKNYDTSRVIDHASGWHDQGGPDLKSVHQYVLPVRSYRDPLRPYVLSEFGGYSRIILNHVWNREKSFGYKMFKSRNKLTKAYITLFEKQIIPLIKKGLSASVYTQISDVEFEVNGLFTYDRELLKIDKDVIVQINEKLKY